MADIDIVIALQGGEKVKAQLTGVTQQTQALAASANTAGTAIDGSSKAFDTLGKSMSGVAKGAALANGSLGAGASILLSLGQGGIVGAAAAAFGFLASQILRSVEEAEKLEKAELDKHMKNVEEAAIAASAGLRAFQKAMAEGKTEEEARELEGLAQASANFAQSQMNSIESVQRLTADLESLRAQESALLNVRGESILEAIRNGQALDDVRLQIQHTAQAIADSIEVQTAGVSVSRDATLAINAEAEARKANDAAINAEAKARADLNAAARESAQDVPEGRSAFATISASAVVAAVDVQTAAASIVSANDAIAASFQASIAGAAVGSISSMATALGQAAASGRLNAKDFGKILRQQAADAINAFGAQATVRAAFELAAGIAEFPAGNHHFVAAAKFAAVAALAGFAAGAIGGGGGGGRGGGTAPSVTSIPDGPSGRDDVRLLPSFHFTIIGNLDTEAREDLLRQLREAALGRDL